jgi:acetyltransferase-like isoleucine patch superfamily enzyme
VETDVFIGFRCILQNTFIKKGVQIASNAKIGGENPTTINKYVWIGAGAVIKGGVSIGEGAIIGANTIVEENVPPYSIMIGQPATKLKDRNIINDGEPNFRNLINTFRINFRDAIKRKKLQKEIEDRYQKGVFNFIDADIDGNLPSHLGDNVIIIGKKITDSSGKLQLDGGISIGKEVSIGDSTIVEGGGKVIIGDNVRIGKNVHIISTSHNYNKLSLPMTLLPVMIEDDVTIEDGVKILGGVTISKGSLVKVNSFVHKNIK